MRGHGGIAVSRKWGLGSGKWEVAPQVYKVTAAAKQNPFELNSLAWGKTATLLPEASFGKKMTPHDQKPRHRSLPREFSPERE